MEERKMETNEKWPAEQRWQNRLLMGMEGCVEGNERLKSAPLKQ